MASRSLSPDNKRLVYFVGSEWPFQMWIFDFIDGTRTKVPAGEGCNEVTWSSAGDKLACSDGLNIYVISLDDGSRTLLTPWVREYLDSAHQPAWSPDGKWIAYAYRQLSDHSIHPEDGVYLTKAACLSKPPTCNTRGRGPFFSYSAYPHIAWSPDSRYLVSADASDWSIKLVDLKTNTARLLVRQVRADWDGIAWSPDGKWIAYSYNGNIYLVSPAGGKPTLVKENTGVVAFWLTIP